MARGHGRRTSGPAAGADRRGRSRGPVRRGAGAGGEADGAARSERGPVGQTADGGMGAARPTEQGRVSVRPPPPPHPDPHRERGPEAAAAGDVEAARPGGLSRQQAAGPRAPRRKTCGPLGPQLHVRVWTRCPPRCPTREPGEPAAGVGLGAGQGGAPPGWPRTGRGLEVQEDGEEAVWCLRPAARWSENASLRWAWSPCASPAARLAVRPGQENVAGDGCSPKTRHANFLVPPLLGRPWHELGSLPRAMEGTGSPGL